MLEFMQHALRRYLRGVDDVEMALIGPPREKPAAGSILLSFLLTRCILSGKLIDFLGYELVVLLGCSKAFLTEDWLALPCGHGGQGNGCDWCDWTQSAAKDIWHCGVAVDQLVVRQSHLTRFVLRASMPPYCVYYLCYTPEEAMLKACEALESPGGFTSLLATALPLPDCEERIVCILHEPNYKVNDVAAYNDLHQSCDSLTFDAAGEGSVERLAVERATDEWGDTEWTRPLWASVTAWFRREWRARYNETILDIFTSKALTPENIMRTPMDGDRFDEDFDRIQADLSGKTPIVPAKWRAMAAQNMRCLPSVLPVHALHAKLASFIVSVKEPSAADWAEEASYEDGNGILPPMLVAEAEYLARNGKTYSLQLPILLENMKSLDDPLKKWRWKVHRPTLEVK